MVVVEPNTWVPQMDAKEATGGWAHKTAALVYMYQQNQPECLEFALKKLQTHPGLQAALNKVKKLHEEKGLACYEKFFGI